MTRRIREAISELQAQLAYHRKTAEQLAQAIGNLEGLVSGGVPRRTTVKRKAAASAGVPKKGKRKKVSLKRALQYVLEQHRKGKVAGVSARQLFDDVQHAGFRFGGSNRENNMNYLYKTLRKNKIFKRMGDGVYGLT